MLTAWRIDMRLFLAITISSLAFAALFALGTFFSIPRYILCPFAAPVFAAIPYIQRHLVRRRDTPAPIIPLSSYAHPDSIVFVYAFFTMVGTLAIVESISIVFE